MTPSARKNLKVAIGLAIGFSIGALCRFLDIPSPAPTLLAGALLVVAMSLGYVLTDRWCSRQAAESRELCGGPDGSLKGDHDD